MDSGGDMSGMGDMGMGDMGGMDGPLSADGVDFSNMTQAMDFLSDLLDDDELKVIGNDYARYFWYGVCVVIALASAKMILRRATEFQRKRLAAQSRPNAARPQLLLEKWLATLTAIFREATYWQYNPQTYLTWFKVPPMGTIWLLLAYLGFVMGLEFVNRGDEGAQYWQALGVRAGWLAVAQVPLIVLLVNKNNLITLVTGVSYERLNVLHRWSSRILLLMSILHFGYQSYGWQHFGIMQLEWATDTCPPTGIAAFALLLWMNLSTLAPFRHWSYEFFVVQHIITFFGFIIAIMYHLPTTALWSRIYIYIPIALYVLDRILRTMFYTWTNLRPSRATLTALDGGVTKVRLSSKAIKKWAPGAHVLVSIPRFGVLQSHPATIASTPTSHNGDLVFILKGHKGFTKRIFAGSNTSLTALLPHTKQETETAQNLDVQTHLALLDGPYGGLQSDFATFDSVLLVAGSTGCTFTLALLQNLAERASSKKLPVRRIHFVWCVRDTTWASWINAEVTAAVATLQRASIDVQVSIFVTCADILTALGADDMQCPCATEKGIDQPCCCTALDEDNTIGEIKPIDATAINVTAKSTASSSSLSRNSADAETTGLLGDGGKRLAVLPCATFYSGRPNLRRELSVLLDRATGESGVAVCGPLGLSAEMRHHVVSLSDERAIHKGTGAQGCHLHVESFS